MQRSIWNRSWKCFLLAFLLGRCAKWLFLSSYGSHIVKYNLLFLYCISQANCPCTSRKKNRWPFWNIEIFQGFLNGISFVCAAVTWIGTLSVTSHFSFLHIKYNSFWKWAVTFYTEALLIFEVIRSNLPMSGTFINNVIRILLTGPN